MVEPVSMETIEFFIFRQKFIYLGRNNISNVGCKWLSKADFRQIYFIDLGNLEII
jgi:hypothetical protein